MAKATKPRGLHAACAVWLEKTIRRGERHGDYRSKLHPTLKRNFQVMPGVEWLKLLCKHMRT
jgi:hypothetical protein